jgi:hypothetical protein
VKEIIEKETISRTLDYDEEDEPFLVYREVRTEKLQMESITGHNCLDL